MDKEARKQRLRARFKALGGLPLPPCSRKVNLQPKQKGGSGKPLPVFYGVSLVHKATDWIAVPNKRRPVSVRPRRIARKSPLWAIEEKWADRPRMPKRYLASRH